MIAEIVSVGTELLMGQVVNTDAQFIARHLAPLGYQAFYQVTVGDNPARLTGAVREALARADVVIFTGWTYEQLVEQHDPAVDDLLAQVDVLIDGPFLLEQRNLELTFRGSENQRLIDMNKTRQQGRVVLLEL